MSSKKHHYTEVLYIIVGLTSVALAAFVFIQRGAKLQRIYLKQEEGTFTELFQLSNDGVVILSENGSLQYSNDRAKVYLEDGVDSFIKEGALNLELLNGNTYKIELDSGRVYFTEINDRDINYNGTECKVYFIKDITRQYLLTHKFERISLLDELTGLSNRRALTNDYEDLILGCEDLENTVLAMIDIDYFKIVNDTYGHDFGDEILKLLGQVFNDRLRQSDTFYRFGGEEFIALIKSIDINSAQKLVMDINQRFSEIVLEKYKIKISFSGGLVSLEDHNGVKDLKTALKMSDELLYKAKDNGRNRIEF